MSTVFAKKRERLIFNAILKIFQQELSSDLQTKIRFTRFILAKGLRHGHIFFCYLDTSSQFTRSDLTKIASQIHYHLASSLSHVRRVPNLSLVEDDHVRSLNEVLSLLDKETIK